MYIIEFRALIKVRAITSQQKRTAIQCSLVPEIKIPFIFFIEE